MIVVPARDHVELLCGEGASLESRFLYAHQVDIHVLELLQQCCDTCNLSFLFAARVLWLLEAARVETACLELDGDPLGRLCVGRDEVVWIGMDFGYCGFKSVVVKLRVCVCFVRW